MSDCKANNELTSNVLFNWRNQGRNRLNYWLKLGVKMACLVHACLNCTNDFRKAEKSWKMMIAQAVCTQLYRWQLWKIARCDLKDIRLGVRAVAEGVSLDRESFPRILKEELDRRIFFCKNVPKTAVRGPKRTSQETELGTFATHWEWTGFVEFDNYLWWNWVFTYDPEAKRQSM